jgi:2-(1,2-epoxy-1,2-dihydrophenyl)acetyl-CoA isomerase
VGHGERYAEGLWVDRDERGVVTVTLDRPHRRNALDRVLFAGLRELCREIADRRGDRAVVITGAGGAFCSGADLSPQGGNSPAEQRTMLAHMRWLGDTVLAVHALPQPTVARVDGVAAGAGWNLALACDLIVASDRSTFSQIFAKRGLTIDFGGSWLLPRLVGMHKAKELALLAEVIDAATADRLGLCNRVVPVDELDATVDDLVGRLAAGPPLALSMTKRLLDQAFDVSLAQAVEAEAQAQSVNGGTADTIEALKAFAEKRTPRFEGR